MRMNHFFMAWRRSGPDMCASLREDFSLCSRAAAACAWHSKRAGQRRSRAHFSVPGQFPKPLADLVERQIDCAGDVASFELIGVSHVHDLGATACERSPVGKREVSPQVIGGDHARVVHGVLRGTKLWRVAKLTFFEVEYRPAKLDRRRDDVDAPLHAGLTNRLCTKNAAVGFAEEELNVNGFRAREVTHMVAGMEIDLFKIHDPSAPQPLFTRAG